MAVKTSILVFYLILTQGEKVFRWANYATLLVTNLAGLALTLVYIFQCNPVGAGFPSTIPPGAECIDIVTLYLSSPVNIITDLAILFLPMPILTKMRLPRRQKTILVITFGFGFFTIVADVVRIAFLQQAATSRRLGADAVHISDNSSLGFSWYAMRRCLSCGPPSKSTYDNLCCVPTIKPLVARLLPKLLRDIDEASIGRNSLPRPGESPVAERPPSANRRSTSFSSRRRGSTGFIRILDVVACPSTRTIDTDPNTAHIDPPNPRERTFFDFVNMRSPDKMLKLTNKESITPNALITLLFFLCIVQLNAWQSMGLHGAYFGGYAVGPLIIGWAVLTRWGFKSTFIVGLCIYGLGALIFWPSAVLTSFVAFTISNFIVGCGLGVLETAANPFISLCGPSEYAEIRLNVSQGVQAIASVVSPLLAQKVLFKDVRDVPSLVNVQWTYLGIALFDVLLAVAFYYVPVPEASDEDLQELADQRQEANMTKVTGIPIVWLTLALGVSSQFFYVAGQEALSTSLESFVSATRPRSWLTPFDFLTVGHTVFAVGRFLTAFAQLFLKPRWTLLISYIGMIVFSVLSMRTTGSAAVAMSMMIYLFESGAFSTIFALSLRGTGRHTKLAASLLASAISGGVYFPFAQQAARLAHGESFPFVIFVALFSAGAIFPLY
ncbi:transporter [Aspergillus sclerotialis]|uniref:Transporter n=1 Tax=Aspergillus sclerotialis TaxID=2070753 RepID=A0A3A2ZLF7_9EURO|nr:transporter [Aspergillus sclerotialis]